MHNNLLDVLKNDFLRTTKTKKLSNIQTLIHHTMKPTLLPMITFLNPLTTHLLTNSMIIKRVGFMVW
jgi:ABC-type dipeptide/oligopeptide/nickel transport systems, permease components